MKKLFKNFLYLCLLVSFSACSSTSKDSSKSSESKEKIVDYGTDSDSGYIIARSTDPSPFIKLFSQDYKKKD